MTDETKATHTPGPLRVHEGIDYIHIYNDGEYDNESCPIAIVTSGRENAELFAAAPEMLAALELVKDALMDKDDPHCLDYEANECAICIADAAVIAAIANAKGDNDG